MSLYDRFPAPRPVQVIDNFLSLCSQGSCWTNRGTANHVQFNHWNLFVHNKIIHQGPCHNFECCLQGHPPSKACSNTSSIRFATIICYKRIFPNEKYVVVTIISHMIKNLTGLQGQLTMQSKHLTGYAGGKGNRLALIQFMSYKHLHKWETPCYK